MAQRRREMNNLFYLMNNPMQNLLDTMKRMIENISGRDYAEVLQLLDEARNAVSDAVSKANKITYELEIEEDRKREKEGAE